MLCKTRNLHNNNIEFGKQFLRACLSAVDSSVIIIFGPGLPLKAQSSRIYFNNASALEITFSDSLYVIRMASMLLKYIKTLKINEVTHHAI